MIRATPVNGFIGGAAALGDHDYNTAVATVTRPVLFDHVVRGRHCQSRCGELYPQVGDRGGHSARPRLRCDEVRPGRNVGPLAWGV